MNLEQLRYIVVLAESRTLQEAADKLQMTSAGLSQSISLLEEELQLPLFERTYRGTEVTADGMKIIDKARVIVQEVNRLKDIAKPSLKKKKKNGPSVSA